MQLTYPLIQKKERKRRGSLLPNKNTKYSWSPRFTSLFRQFIADHLCWQETTIKMTPEVKDYTTSVHISAHADRPSAALSLQFSIRRLTVCPGYNSLSCSLILPLSLSLSFSTFLQSLNPLSLTPCVPFAVSIWDLQAVVCQQQSSKETGAPRAATGKGHQWVKNVNIQPSSGHSHGETGMKITPITQHRQGGNTEDREGRDTLWMREQVRWTHNF